MAAEERPWVSAREAAFVRLEMTREERRGSNESKISKRRTKLVLIVRVGIEDGGIDRCDVCMRACRRDGVNVRGGCSAEHRERRMRGWARRNDTE